MATSFTKSDSLGLYLSGASSNGAAQDSPDACLGGYRSAIEAKRMAFLVETGMYPIRVDWISGSNGTGLGYLYAQGGGSSLTWVPSGGTVGSAVAIANGETKLIEATATAQSIRITRDSTNYLKGAMTLRLLELQNDLLGMDNVTSAEAAAGLNTYRAAFLRNHSDASITDIKLYIKTLGTQRVSGTAQLGGAGSGTITTATADGFADWPSAGWCHIKNAGTTREIVYYTSRTATSLTVPAAGRARLGTSAGAGAGTDTIDAVPGIRIGLEAPSSNVIQTIANDSTAPSGITWNAQTTSAAGLSIATLTASSDYGLWIHREIPAGAYADDSAANAIDMSFVYSAVTYTTTWKGLYRIANSALDLYELYVGVDADATYTATTATSATLPFNYAVTPPGAGTDELRCVVRRRNQHNLVSQNRYQRVIKIDSSGNEVVKSPTAPSNVALVDSGGGMVRIRANYEAEHDDPKANQWALYVTGDGTNPTGSETPIFEDMRKSFGIFAPGSALPLNRTLGPYVQGQDLRVLLRTRHAGSGSESTNTTPATLTVGTGHTGAIAARAVLVGAGYGQRLINDSIARTEYYDVANNVRAIYALGYTDFYIGSTWVWRLKYDTSGASNNGLWTTFEFVQNTISGTPADTPVEVNSATVVYMTANAVRRLKIDVTATTIEWSAFNQGVLTVPSSNAPDAVYDASFSTLFQVFDPYTADYKTAMALDADGILRANVPLRQRATTGDFE